MTNLTALLERGNRGLARKLLRAKSQLGIGHA